MTKPTTPPLAEMIRQQLANPTDPRVVLAEDDDRIEAAAKVVAEQIDRERHERNLRRWGRSYAYLMLAGAVGLVVLAGIGDGANAAASTFYAAFAGFMGAILWTDTKSD